MKSNSKKSFWRQGRVLLGLGVLLFAGYAIVLHARKLQPQKALSLLGERVLMPNAATAFRLIGWDLKRNQPLEINRVELRLKRPLGTDEILLRKTGNLPVVDLNVRLPDWSDGPATLQAEVDTKLGALDFETTVVLDSEPKSSLRLLPLESVLGQPAVFIQKGPASRRGELAGMVDDNQPAKMLFFAQSGTLSAAFKSELLVLVLDRNNNPVQGRLRVRQANNLEKIRPSRTGEPFERKTIDRVHPHPPRSDRREYPSPASGRGVIRHKSDVRGEGGEFSDHWYSVDQTGFVLVKVGGQGRTPKVKLFFENEQGSLSSEVTFKHHKSPLDIYIKEPLVKAGDNITLLVQSLESTTKIYIDGWWKNGWCLSAQAQVSNHQASVPLSIPRGVEGPLVIRVRSDFFGVGNAYRDGMLMVAKGFVPTVEQGIMSLLQVPAEKGFWQEYSYQQISYKNLLALLSKVGPRVSSLPELVDASQAEKKSVLEHRSDLISFGLWWVAILSCLTWLVVAGILFARIRQVGAQKDRHYWLVFMSALGICALALGSGWFWLYWIVN
jgi:hypothetical protein